MSADEWFEIVDFFGCKTDRRKRRVFFLGNEVYGHHFYLLLCLLQSVIMHLFFCSMNNLWTYGLINVNPNIMMSLCSFLFSFDFTPRFLPENSIRKTIFILYHISAARVRMMMDITPMAMYKNMEGM